MDIKDRWNYLNNITYIDKIIVDVFILNKKEKLKYNFFFCLLF